MNYIDSGSQAAATNSVSRSSGYIWCSCQ